jgi:putative lipoic acid-binding regulatory protein
MSSQLPSLELLESMHTFPGPFIFKIIGNQRNDFLADALLLATGAIGEQRPSNHSIRISSGGQHIAVTLSIHLKTASEVHLIYANLLKLPGLKALF